MEIGQIVVSGAGRDQERLLVILDFDGATPLVADGKERPLERPKKKNPKHLRETGYCLAKEEYRSNKSLKAALGLIRINMMNSERGHSNV